MSKGGQAELEELINVIITSRDTRHRQEKIYQLYTHGAEAIKYLEVRDEVRDDTEVLKKCKELLAKLQDENRGIFTEILVAIDGSKESMDAADYGIYLAKLYKASTTILHVLPKEIRYAYDNVDTIQPNIPASPVKGIVELSKQEAEEKWFSKIMEKAKQIDVQSHSDVIVATRSIVAEIVDYAHNLNADLIIVGTRGRSGIKRMLLGSVASGIITYAHCPVLVVK